MGFYTRFKDAEARAEIVRYYQFLKKHDDLFRWHEPSHQTLLLFPRRAIHDGDMRPLARFREVGTQMLDKHMLFDIRPDDAVTPEITSRYHQIVSVEAETPTPPHIAGRLFLSNAPKTVRVSLSKHPQREEFAIHLVNYNRIEPAEKHSAGRGIQDEKPIPVEGVSASFGFLRGATVTAEFLTPESPEPIALEMELSRGRVDFVVPKFLVYGVIRIRIDTTETP